MSRSIPRKEVKVVEEEFVSIEELAKVFADENTVQLFTEKVKKFFSLPEEERKKRVVRFIEYIASLFKEKSPVEAGLTFLELLKTPECVIYFLYLWKPKYRETVLGLLYYVLQAVRRMGYV